MSQSIRAKALRRGLLAGGSSLRPHFREFLQHYNSERNHQGLDNRLIEPGTTVANDNGPIQRTERLGGLLNFYHRGAA